MKNSHRTQVKAGLKKETELERISREHGYIEPPLNREGVAAKRAMQKRHAEFFATQAQAIKDEATAHFNSRGADAAAALSLLERLRGWAFSGDKASAVLMIEIARAAELDLSMFEKCRPDTAREVAEALGYGAADVIRERRPGSRKSIPLTPVNAWMAHLIRQVEDGRRFGLLDVGALSDETAQAWFDLVIRALDKADMFNEKVSVQFYSLGTHKKFSAVSTAKSRLAGTFKLLTGFKVYIPKDSGE